ncbi:MAG: 3-hydroxyacyl-CoA dehydrogenase/enoyl-CoA hydratase family protein [Saprospiraceae bacterium]
MDSRRIKKVAVLGSGLMGSGIATHFAGCGFEVLLLDLTSQTDDRNKIVRQSLATCLAAKPSNIFHKNFSQCIDIGNYDDDLSKISSVDWIIEVVIENLEIKKQLYEKIEQHRKTGTLVTTNTSGIPIHFLTEGRTVDFKKWFCGTHFFNPPRYLKLLEIIPTSDTHPKMIEFLLNFGSKFLGKQTVICKDTPAFIANRIGVVSMAKIFELALELKLPISTVDKLTGQCLGRPKSGTFRLTDVVGLDTALKVIDDLKKNCPEDMSLQKLQVPAFLNFLQEKKWYGNKTSKGFYEKTNNKDEKGRPIILELDLESLEYKSEQKLNLESLQLSKQIDDLPKRINAIIKANDLGAELIKKSLAFLFAYASNRIPEISDNIYSIDHALKGGYAWDLGPFELWDVIGLEHGLRLIESVNERAADWVYALPQNGISTFYVKEGSQLKCYDINSKSYEEIPGQEDIIQLNLIEKQSTVYENAELRLVDLGDGVLCAEFRSKHNAIGEGILKGLNDCIRIAEEQGWKGLVIGNNANNFTVGANIMLIGMLAFQQEYEQLDMAVRLFQQTSMRLRTSGIPVVIAAQGYVFGGGTEFLMHCDASVCAVESYIGLVEVGVGLIPGGGGTKEFALRFADEMKESEVLIPQLIQKFKTIATASVATSAYEAYDYGYLNYGRDSVSINCSTQIFQAKQKVIQLSEYYIPKSPRKDIMVLGRSGLGTLYTAAHSLWRAGYASEHDIKIAKKIAYVLCGGDLSYPQKVSEQYLLDIEREAFLSLCTEPKTLERIQYMLENNKPLRN